jgi:hypothetical protein
VEFLDFMNRMVKQYQGKEIHVVLDNLSTHKLPRLRGFDPEKGHFWLGEDR